MTAGTGAEGPRSATHGQARRRASHRALLLRILRRNGPATRQELVRQSGLSLTTVASLVAELESHGQVTQTAIPHGRSGRRPVLVSFDRTAGAALAVDIGPRRLAVAVGSRLHPVLAERRVDLPSGHEARATERLLLACIDQVLTDARVGPEVLLGAALALPGASRPDRGCPPVLGPAQGLWAGTVARMVSRRWQIPVAVESSAGLGALAESSRGEAAGAHTVLNVAYSGGIEVGIAIGGTLHRGRTGRAGSLGHLVVRPGGRFCRCGRRGCLEAYLDDKALRRVFARDRGAAASATTRPGPGRVTDLDTDGITLLAEAVATAVLLLDPSVIVLGGALAPLGERLAGPLRSALRALPFDSTALVLSSTLGERAALLGGVELVLAAAGDPGESPAPGPARES
ncbi:ROK family protein [Streptomyces sp. NRRL B-24484]|uniref:ROK family protein n=1 Tax=Streptomyces sp. NRRL B-24484 TaxID=1463833 RepID=UPI0004BE5634|nr:ROK family protein [Streptomyces sp. NRRL B-24484]